MIEDEDGERLISSPLRLTVVANTPPDLRLTNASWPEHQAGNDGISIYVQAKDPDGKKGKKPTYDGLKVEIYNFDKLMGTASPFLNRGKNPSFPDFFFVWERATAGDYSIRVVATDKDGNTTRLKLLNFSIKPPQ